MAIFYDDIISMPWQCGDRDCEHKWHMSCYSYCEDSGNLLVSDYADGDWQDGCDYELPCDEEITQAWHSYAAHVVKTGEDPLDVYYVEYSRKTQQKWQIRMKLSIVGVVLLGCRRNSRGDWHRNPPKELVEFMGWKQVRDGGWHLDEDLYERAEYCDLLRKEGKDWTPQRSKAYEFKGIAHISVQIDRPDNRVRQDLRRVARKDLKRMDLSSAQVCIPDPPKYAWHLMRIVDGKEHTIGVFRPSDGQDVMGCDMDEWMWKNGHYGEHSPDDYEWDGDSESVAIMAKREGMPEYRFERKEIS